MGDAGPDEIPLASPAAVTWHCFPVCESPLWRRLLRRGEGAQALETFDRALREILESEPRVTLADEP